MNSTELLSLWNAAKGDLPKEQAFLFQHCQDMMQAIYDLGLALDGAVLERDILEAKHKVIEKRLVQRIGQLKASNGKLREALIRERAQLTYSQG